MRRLPLLCSCVTQQSMQLQELLASCRAARCRSSHDGRHRVTSADATSESAGWL
jgi:hypothetical protein